MSLDEKMRKFSVSKIIICVLLWSLLMIMFCACNLSASKCEHMIVVDEAKLPTCTENGLSEGKHCLLCNEIIVEQTIISATGHKESAAVQENIISATCETPGTCDIVVYCETCGEELARESKTTDALGHDIVFHMAKLPTCTEIGWDSYETCSRCDYTTYKEKDVGEHKEGAAVQENIIPATCETPGTYDVVVYCEICGEELTRESKTTGALGHKIVFHMAQKPTCTEIGWDSYKTCSRCDYTTYIEKPKAPHEYTNEGFCTDCDHTAFLMSLGDDKNYIVTALNDDYKHSAFIIPNNYLGLPVTAIGSNAFYGLREITIPSSIIKIENDAFANCQDLETVYYLGDFNQWVQIEFDSATANPKFYADNLYAKGALIAGTTTISSAATKLNKYALLNCDAITGLILPLSIESIEEGALSGCGGLEELTIPFVGSKLIESADIAYQYPLGYLFGSEKYEGGVETKQCFYGKTPGTMVYATYVIPESLRKVVVQSGHITSGAFYGCSNVECIVIGEDVVGIGERAFYQCVNLDSIEYIGLPPIGAVGAYAFAGCSKLQTISIPQGVKTIGDYAFAGCSKLKTIIIPNSVESMGRALMFGCSSLEELHIPFVGNRANINANSEKQYPLGYLFGMESYEGCEKINQKYYRDGPTILTTGEFYIPSTLDKVVIDGGYLPVGALNDCGNLKTIILGNRVTGIAAGVLNGCGNLEELVLPFVGNRKIESADVAYQYPLGYLFGTAFYLNSISIQQYFYEESLDTKSSYNYIIPASLKDVTINGGYITSGAFYGCINIARLEIADGVVGVAEGALFGCSSIKELELNFVGDRVGLSAEDTNQYPVGYLFGTSSYEGSVGTKQLYYGNSLEEKTTTEYYIPVSLSKVVFDGGYIPSGALSNCIYIKDIIVEEGVSGIGEGAFSGCSSLECIELSFIGNRPQIDEDDEWQYPIGYLFGKDSYDGGVETEQYYYADYINGGSGSTEQLDIVSSIYYIPQSLSTVILKCGFIPYSAFDSCSNVKTIVLSDQTQKIPGWAFSNSGIEQIVIPAGVKSIGKAAFAYCHGLKSVIFEGSESELSDVGDQAFYDCTSLISIDFSTAHKLSHVGAYAFAAGASGISSLKSIVFSDDCFLTTLSSKAFYGCRGLEYVKLPSKLNTISEEAFYYCDSLVNIELPQMLKKIEKNAFLNCKKLVEITMHSNIEFIGENAFDKCDSLENLFYTGTEEEWDELVQATYQKYLDDPTKYSAQYSNGLEIIKLANVKVTCNYRIEN